jgi:hypothetical protein
MSDGYDELGRTLRTLLLEEAEAMEIDTHTASERLARELAPDPGRRRVPMTAVGVVAAAVVAVGVALLWSGGPEGRGTVPADDPARPTGDATTAAAPYFVDPGTLERTPVPDALAEIAANEFFLSFSPNGDRIAWDTCASDNGRCSADDKSYVANADGTGQQQVTFPGGLNSYGEAWSPDGTKLLYQVRRGGSYEVGNLFLYDVESGEATQLTDLERSQPYWRLSAGFSTDGAQVVYDLARPPGLYPTGVQDVWSVEATGGASTRLVREARTPAHLADGRLAFVRDATILAAEPGAQPTALALSDNFLASPDGTRIAYVDAAGFYVLDIASGESIALGLASECTWAGNDRLLVWPPE